MVKIIKKHGSVNHADLSDLYYSWNILWNNYIKLFINRKSDFFIYTVSLHKNLVRYNNIILLNSSIVLISVQYRVCIIIVLCYTFSVTDIHFIVVLSAYSVNQKSETSLNFVATHHAVIRKVRYFRAVIRRSV